jgi:UDP-N-acetyl-2-amino-2-deoxyglucuronate dehydrogenase
MKNFAIIGAGGYVAPRHMQAIKETGNNLIAALDIHDSVGILDSYFPKADFFTAFERFDRHLEKEKRLGNRTDYIAVCSPNYLHDAHIRFGLRFGSDVICEKPIVLNPWNIDALAAIEKETGKKVFTILQLRLLPAIQALKTKIDAAPAGKKYRVNLQYITARGNWYHNSWKGDIQKSGGIATNIGVHFFDLLSWMFVGGMTSNVNLLNGAKGTGELELEKADVEWMLSIDENMLPDTSRLAGKTAHRSLIVDDDEMEFSDGFGNLHTRSYEEIIAGNGFTLPETGKVTALVHEIRNQL